MAWTKKKTKTVTIKGQKRRISVGRTSSGGYAAAAGGGIAQAKTRRAVISALSAALIARGVPPWLVRLYASHVNRELDRLAREKSAKKGTRSKRSSSPRRGRSRRSRR